LAPEAAFCTNCGQKVEGKFCAACGTPRPGDASPAGGALPPPTA
jgi:hypothetical protein